jgi:hypothetical protein
VERLAAGWEPHTRLQSCDYLSVTLQSRSYIIKSCLISLIVYAANMQPWCGKSMCWWRTRHGFHWHQWQRPSVTTSPLLMRESLVYDKVLVPPSPGKETTYVHTKHLSQLAPKSTFVIIGMLLKKNVMWMKSYFSCWICKDIWRCVSID